MDENKKLLLKMKKNILTMKIQQLNKSMIKL